MCIAKNIRVGKGEDADSKSKVPYVLMTQDLEYVNMNDFFSGESKSQTNRYTEVGVKLLTKGLTYNNYWGYLWSDSFKEDNFPNLKKLEINGTRINLDDTGYSIEDMVSATEAYFKLKSQIGGGKLMCLSVVRDYYHRGDDLINRRLQVWNFNAIYDTREFYISMSEVDGSIHLYLSPGNNIMFTEKNTVATLVFESGGSVITVGTKEVVDTGGTLRFVLDIKPNLIPSGTSSLGIYLTVNNTIYYVETEFSR